MTYLSWTLIFIVSTLAVTYGQQANTQDDCKSQKTCTACIRAPNCTWCNIVVDEGTKEVPVRCVNQQILSSGEKNLWCNGGKRINRKSNIKFNKNEKLFSGKRNKQIQIQPQDVKLELRRGQEYRFTLRYRQAEDYPVDLYFAADYSWSMQPFWKQLKKLGTRIVKAMKKLTSNFRMGLGSFVDKDIRPMVRARPKWDEFYHYSFKHYLSLTNDSELFVKKVGEAHWTGNGDDPEAGFDALIQAMVCKEKIGWRSDARHIIVHVSNDILHLAGDGKFAGLPEPNDLQCHLNKTGYYSHAELQDYPSIGQIRWQAIENNVNIIFMTIKEFKGLYDGVQSMIPGSSVGILRKDSDNIVELITSHYEKLVKTITMKSNWTSNFLNIKYFSSCLSKTEKPQQRNQCGGIRVNDTVEFEVVLKVMDCPDREEDWHQIIEIKPEGINEGVIVNVELICDCECSKNIDKKKTKICNNKGILDCGVCSCDQGYHGQSCQCEGAMAINRIDENSCRVDNTSKICNGHGGCICGSCRCDKVGNSEQHFYGTFCQCDDLSCRYEDGKLCGGNGRCECGECKCNSGWGGLGCGCRDDITLCLPPGDNAKICSGAGKCVCGECMCDPKKGRQGRFCEDCPSCPSQRCDEFKDCVECKVHKSGKLYEEDKDCLQCYVKIEKVDEIEEDQENKKHVCRVPGDDGSTIVFTYTYVNDKHNQDVTIFAKKEKEFPVIDDFLAVTIGVVILTLLLGLLILLIWKIVTHVHDKREYDRFVKFSSQANWGQGQNPLYRETVTTVQNPVFNRKSGRVDL